MTKTLTHPTDTEQHVSRELSAALKNYPQTMASETLRTKRNTWYVSPALGRGEFAVVACPTLGIEVKVAGDPVRLAQKLPLTVKKVAGRRVQTCVAFRLAGQSQWTFVNSRRSVRRFSVHVGLEWLAGSWIISVLSTPGWRFGAQLEGEEFDSLQAVFDAVIPAFYEDEAGICALPRQSRVNLYIPVVDEDSRPDRILRLRESDLVEEGRESKLSEALFALSENKRAALFEQDIPSVIEAWSEHVDVDQRRVNLAELPREINHPIYQDYLVYANDPEVGQLPRVEELCALLGSMPYQ